MKRIISTENAPGAIGPYSQGVRAGNFVFVSGQIPIDPKTGEFPAGGIEEQAKQSLENLKAILAVEGYTMEDVVKTTVLLDDINDFAAANKVYAEYFTKDCPARACFAVAKIPKGALIEIEVIAYKD